MGKQNENKLFGIVGALLGTVVGVGLYFVVSRFNIFSFWIPFVSVAISMYLYEKFANGKSLSGIIIVTLMNMFMMFFAEMLDLAQRISEVYYDVTLWDILPYIMELYADPDIDGGVLQSLFYAGLAALLSLISGFMYWSDWRKKQKQATLQATAVSEEGEQLLQQEQSTEQVHEEVESVPLVADNHQEQHPEEVASEYTGSTTVTIVSVEGHFLEAVRILREALGYDLLEAKQVLDQLPYTLTVATSKEAATLRSQLKEAGVIVEE